MKSMPQDANAINDFDARHWYHTGMRRFTPAERVRRVRERRRRGQILATVRLGPVEAQKLAALGYLDPVAPGAKGPALDTAAEAYISDKLAEEKVTFGSLV
jgi:hypothetical protein